jgi:hypothetical protein
MAHYENDIKQAIAILLRQEGQLNTSEIKGLLNTVMPFDSEDMIPSPTRNGEPLIMQRIGNVVSHMETNPQVYRFFTVDKSVRPAIFTYTG